MFSFLRRKKIDPRAKLKKVLGSYTLPSFPGVVVELLSKLRDPESSSNNIAQLIAVDPALTVTVFRVANSAVFSPVKKIQNLRQAVALVGFSQLETLVLSNAVNSSLPRPTIMGYDFDQFWSASVRRGVLASEIAKIICPSKISESFTAGVLQDFAIPFLVLQRPDEYLSILKKWNETGADLTALERQIFSWDHAEVATWICNEWQLPEDIAAAIGGHHNKLYNCPTPVSLVAVLSENEECVNMEVIVNEALQRYNIPPEQTRTMIENAFNKASDYAKLMK